MGLFSGGFLGSGSDESTTSSTTTTNVTTETTTNVHDVGLTGAEAVNLAAVLGSAANASAAQNAVVAQQFSQDSAIVQQGYANMLTAINKENNQSLRSLGTNQLQGLTKVLDTSKAVFTDTTGKASDFIDQMLGIVGTIGNKTQEILGDVVQGQQAGYEKLLTVTSDTTNPALSLGKDLVFVIGMIGVAFFIMGGK